MPATHRRLTGDIEFYNGNTSFQLPSTHRRHRRKVETCSTLFSIAVPATSRNLYGNMTAVGRRWIAGSFKRLLDFNTTKNDFHFSFILKFSTEKSSPPVDCGRVKSLWKHASVAILPVGRQWVADIKSYMETRLKGRIQTCGRLSIRNIEKQPTVKSVLGDEVACCIAVST